METKKYSFLDEIKRTKEHFKTWPQWMKDATIKASASLPKFNNKGKN